jgi:CheY-like chemotaxis protein/anti-sigma regulatory factor (Ser/Thr protein kinase)
VIVALKQAQEGAQRIRTTCDDLRVFSRSEDGEPQPVQLRRVLESAIAMAWTQIRHRARLTRDFHELPPMAASENRLAQVFLNLLINAAQAIPEGDVAGNEIHVALRHAGAHAEIEVSDTGTGISAGAAEKLFQPFFTTKPQGVGTGLGLSICHKIVTDYQGEISARPNGSRGTTFRVRLPLVTVPPRPATRTPTSKPSARRGRVLVIDDEPAIVDLIIRVLRAEHEVVGSAGAGPALALLRAGQEFDVIFCDLMMPDISGVDFYHELAGSAPHIAERVIFLSGGAFTASARQLLQSVPNLSVQKPFDSSGLRALVRERLVRDSRPPTAATRASP